MSSWHMALEAISSSIFKIRTSLGHGTGFKIFSNEWGIVGIATALHVVQHADEWQEPIKIVNHVTGSEKMVLASDLRVVFSDPQHDLAFIVCEKEILGEVQESSKPILLGPDRYAKAGVEIGWCGFPAIARDQLCFFTGNISAFLKEQSSYLVDGVAINGVSGGPAFLPNPDDPSGTPLVFGIVTEYWPNYSTGSSLPGLAYIASVESLHSKLSTIKSVDEARRKRLVEVNTLVSPAPSNLPPDTEELQTEVLPKTPRRARKSSISPSIK